MAVELEWNFEDKGSQRPPQQERQPRRFRWRAWLILGVVALSIAAGVYAWYRSSRETLMTVEAEVQAVAQLELRAAVERDTALFLSLQDEAFPTWRKAQEARAWLDAFLPPPLPNLTLGPDFVVENARVVGDAARVEVVSVAGLPDGEMGPFRAARFYRRSSDGRWLHTSADLDDAGHTVVFSGGQVTVTSFAIDTEWTKAAAYDLEGLAIRFCSLVSCQQGQPLMLDFTGTLDDVLEPEGVLPAPFLVGVPDDETASEVWMKALRELAFDRLLVREWGPSMGSGADELFRTRFRDWLRAKLGLRDPIAPDLDLVGEALDAGELIPLDELRDLAPAADATGRELAEAEIDLLLALIEEEYGRSRVARLFQGLGQTDQLDALIEQALEEDWESFQRRFTVYVREATGRPSGTIEPPAEIRALTEYDLMAVCGGTFSLWGLRLDQPAAPASVSPTTGFGTLLWSPDGSRLLVQHGAADDSGYYLLDADGSAVRQLTGIPGGTTVSAWSPDGSYVAYSRSGESHEGGLVDVEMDERVAQFGFFPAWSSDGSRLAYATSAELTQHVWIAEGDGMDPRQVGEGHVFSWAPDGTRIALLSPEYSLNVVDVATAETETLLDESTLYEMFDLKAENTSLRVQSLAWSPTGEWIGLGVDQYETNDAGMLKLMQGRIALVHPDGTDLHTLSPGDRGITLNGWSPDGRWLSGHIYAGAQFTTTVIGIDGTVLLEAGVGLAWSPDGQYLAVTGEDRMHILHFTEPETRTWQLFEVPIRCQFAAWNPRGPLHELPLDPEHTAASLSGSPHLSN